LLDAFKDYDALQLTEIFENIDGESYIEWWKFEGMVNHCRDIMAILTEDDTEI
jgi:hypothetical protein